MSVRGFGVLGFAVGAAFSIALTASYVTLLILILTALTAIALTTALPAYNSTHPIRIAALAALSLVAATAHISALSRPATDVVAVANVQSSDVKRAHDGQFRATAKVNGGEIEMLFDTGASIVLLTHNDATAVGLDTSTLSFKLPILTANGKSYVAPITLDHIRIGNVEVRDVRAAVAKPGHLHASLLGTSFIGKIEEAVIRKDRLILRN